MDILNLKPLTDWLLEQAPVVVVALLWIYSLVRSNIRLQKALIDATKENTILLKEGAAADKEVAAALAAGTSTMQALQQTVQMLLANQGGR